jgi:tetratricopeptide (TPR) repeat protein
MTLKGTKYTVKEIAEKVNVRYVLEGSVRKIGHDLRITAQLIDAVNDYHIWAEKYNKSIDNIFEIQENVSRSITEALKVKLNPEERKQTANLRAYDLYLLGRYYWNKRSREGLLTSIEYFRKAVESDKNYALAYAGLADAYSVCASWNYMSPEIAFEKATEYAQLSLSLDNNAVEAYATSACISETFNRNYERAEELYLIALSLNPNYASAHQWYSLFLTIFGRFDEAVTHMNYAVKLDPLSAIKNAACGQMYYYAESYDNSIQQCRKSIEVDPEFPVSLVSFMIFLCFFQKGFMPEAIDEYQKVLIDTASFEEYKNNARKIYSESGINGFLNFIIDLELKNPETKNPVQSLRKLAFFYAMRGNKQKALDYIEINVNEFITDYIYIKVEPVFKDLRSEPRFIALLKKLGLEK